MGKPYSIDLRERVQGEIESGGSRRAAARRYDVSPSFAVKLAERVSRTEPAEPARQGRPPGGGKLALYLAALLEWVEAKSDILQNNSVAPPSSTFRGSEQSQESTAYPVGMTGK